MAPVDTIDLTFSSSDESPSRTPLPRSRPSGVVKRESIPYHSRPIKPESSQPVPAFQNVASNQQVRTINPAHLERIISTSDVFSLKRVLLDLCKTSPALSNAVARGLSRHSTFAQGVIAEHKRNQQAAQPGPPAVDMRRDAMRWTQMNANSHPRNMNPPKSPLVIKKAESGFRDSKSFLYDSRDFSPSLRVPTPTPRVKNELKHEDEAEVDLDDFDSDGCPIEVPRAFSNRTQPRIPMRTPLHTAPGSSNAVNSPYRTPSASQRMTSARRKPTVPRRQCARCENYITPGDDSCFYHSGTRIEQEDGTLIWNCCNEAVGIFGCKFGSHVESEGTPASLSTLKLEPESEVKTCAKCFRPFKEDASGCVHHPGTTIKGEDGQKLWSCCRKPLVANGCSIGNHIEGDPLVKRPPGSPVSPFKSQYKKFRMD
ncbi:hypothetical protein IQ07DRAFT_111602 [Pyrenochaeta sp. DS3sAY3a]|nr:hypothetical protein IQ07DRAFT_111602 [Pyrenochaeta sp. DS3sAY3a]